MSTQDLNLSMRVENLVRTGAVFAVRRELKLNNGWNPGNREQVTLNVINGILESIIPQSDCQIYTPGILTDRAEQAFYIWLELHAQDIDPWEATDLLMEMGLTHPPIGWVDGFDSSRGL